MRIGFRKDKNIKEAGNCSCNAPRANPDEKKR